MSRRTRGLSLPTWMWFFIALPVGLAFAWLWQRRAAKSLMLRKAAPLRRLRYAEPDSIPIDTRPNFVMSEMEEAALTDHAFAISEAALESARSNPPLAAQAAAETADDDLQVIEGIGPKISALLKANGVTTFRQLASTPFERLHEILAEAKLQRLANPASWAEQAQLAARDDWEGLRQLQAALKGGRRKV